MQFPAHIIEIVTVCWMADPMGRPNFAQILPKLESYASPEEQSHCVLTVQNHFSNTYDVLTDEDEAVSDLDEEFLTDDGICTEQKIVSRLKNRWEQLSVGLNNGWIFKTSLLV